MIIDPEDKTYIKEEGVFTEQEISEIKSTRLKNYIERLPDDFAEYLNKFNPSSTEELREQLRIANGWESHYNIDESHNLDWLKHTIHDANMMRLEAFCFVQVVWYVYFTSFKG